MSENLTGYVEVDPAGYISETSSRVTLEYMTGNVDAYLYKDFNASNFDKIGLQFAGRISSSSGYNGQCAVGFTNVLDDGNNWYPVLQIIFYRYSPTSTYHIILYDGNDWDIYQIYANTTYYLTLSRAAGSDTATLKIYSDSSRTTLVTTLSVDGVGTSTKFRYFYPAASINIGDGTDYFYGYFEEFVFNPVNAVGGAQIIGLSSW